MRRLAALVSSGSICLSSCGGLAPDSDLDELGTTHAALCAGAPEREGGVVTRHGCRFEQQVRNIGVYGEAFDPQLLFSAAGEPIAEVTYSCDGWWLGTDLDGVPVILEAEVGHVLSHGTLHAGFEMTRLPDELPVPFALH